MYITKQIDSQIEKTNAWFTHWEKLGEGQDRTLGPRDTNCNIENR